MYNNLVDMHHRTDSGFQFLTNMDRSANKSHSSRDRCCSRGHKDSCRYFLG